MSTIANDNNIDDYDEVSTASAAVPDDYFGLCPHCGRHDGYINIHSDHVFVCHEHRTWWCPGSNSVQQLAGRDAGKGLKTSGCSKVSGR